ncbi:Dihydrolipoamide branched chain transacylase E2 [Carabus blaptoides fortunei]
MSVCNNTFMRFVLPLLNKTYRHKTEVPIWNINRHTKQHLSYSVRHNSYRNCHASITQFRSICTTNSFNKNISFNLSDIGEGIREVIVKEWYVKEGDKVSQFDNICEVQSDKASVTITSRYDGVITKLYHEIDGIALVGQPLIDIECEDDEPKNVEDTKIKSSTIQKTKTEDYEVKPTKNEIDETHVQEDISDRGFAIPSVRRIAKENKIRLADVKGTGKDGRVLKEDILNFMKTLSQPEAAINDVQIKPIRGYTKTMIKTMTEAMKIPHFVYHDEICVTNLVKLKQTLNAKMSEINVKLTYMPFFIKAVSNALSKYPVLNSKIDDKQDNIIYYNSHNIGVAMDTPGGLAVPVIKNVQSKTLLEITKELNRLQELGKNLKFTPADLSDGTFTISNIGAIGGTYAKPIILPPQSAILALGKFQLVPRFIDGDVTKIGAETIGYISGAADHRIVDGASMAGFCNHLKQEIEQPYFLFVNI